MSHFYTLVMVSQNDIGTIATRKEIENKIADLMEQYSENNEVDEYDQKCYCIGQIARYDANKICEDTFGTMENIRNDYWKKVNALIGPEIVARGGSEFFEAQRITQEKVDWAKHLEHWNILEKKTVENHPMKDKPDPKCTECNGTGTYKSTCNPDSKWDWYSIGGRWSGVLSDYDPETDPDNTESCIICGGTGKRNDDLGKKARQENPNYTCNGCDGKGKRTKWPTQWKKHDGDMQPTDKVIQMIKKDNKYCPHALVTPDGRWYEMGEMGWFGISNDNKDHSIWKDEVIRLLKIFKNSIAVVVDCHI